MAKISTKDKINIISVDSLKLRIPLTLVDIRDKSIYDHYIELNASTGEMSTEFPKTKFKEYYLSKTSKVKVGIEKRITAQGKADDCLIIYLNSKSIKQRYFEAIHMDIIESIYGNIMALNVFHVDYETFLRSDCTDIDFKLDEVMTQLEWSEVINQFKLATIPSKQSDKGYTAFKPTKNQPYQNGLQYNKRATATMSKPFLKLYWKGGELLSNSKDYRDEHLLDFTDEELLQIVRIETTVKNKKHANKLGIQDVTLLGLLSLTEETKVNVFRQIFTKYLDKPKRQTVIDKLSKKDKLKPSDQIYYVAIVSLMDHTKSTSNEVIESLIQTVECKVSKSRQKMHLNSIYENFIKGNDVDIRTEKINSFFTKFKWVS